MPQSSIVAPIQEEIIEAIVATSTDSKLPDAALLEATEASTSGADMAKPSQLRFTPQQDKITSQQQQQEVGLAVIATALKVSSRKPAFATTTAPDLAKRVIESESRAPASGLDFTSPVARDLENETGDRESPRGVRKGLIRIKFHRSYLTSPVSPASTPAQLGRALGQPRGTVNFFVDPILMAEQEDKLPQLDDCENEDEGAVLERHDGDNNARWTEEERAKAIKELDEVLGRHSLSLTVGEGARAVQVALRIPTTAVNNENQRQVQGKGQGRRQSEMLVRSPAGPSPSSASFLAAKSGSLAQPAVRFVSTSPRSRATGRGAPTKQQSAGDPASEPTVGFSGRRMSSLYSLAGNHFSLPMAAPSLDFSLSVMSAEEGEESEQGVRIESGEDEEKDIRSPSVPQYVEEAADSASLPLSASRSRLLYEREVQLLLQRSEVLSPPPSASSERIPASAAASVSSVLIGEYSDFVESERNQISNNLHSPSHPSQSSSAKFEQHATDARTHILEEMGLLSRADFRSSWHSMQGQTATAVRSTNIDDGAQNETFVPPSPTMRRIGELPKDFPSRRLLRYQIKGNKANQPRMVKGYTDIIRPPKSLPPSTKASRYSPQRNQSGASPVSPESHVRGSKGSSFSKAERALLYLQKDFTAGQVSISAQQIFALVSQEKQLRRMRTSSKGHGSPGRTDNFAQTGVWPGSEPNAAKLSGSQNNAEQQEREMEASSVHSMLAALPATPDESGTGTGTGSRDIDSPTALSVAQVQEEQEQANLIDSKKHKRWISFPSPHPDLSDSLSDQEDAEQKGSDALLA